MIKTDILIIGAGPTGLFTVFEAGLLKLKCHLIDALPQPGGQCSEIYPKKPIYDIPAFPEILAGDLVDNLMKQIQPFQPGFTLGERAQSIQTLDDGTFIVTTNKGTKHHAPIVAIACYNVFNFLWRNKFFLPFFESFLSRYCIFSKSRM